MIVAINSSDMIIISLAVEPLDYTPLSSVPVDVPPMATNGDKVCVNVSIVDDNVAELSETFVAQFRIIANAFDLTQGATINIIDNDHGGCISAPLEPWLIPCPFPPPL